MTMLERLVVALDLPLDYPGDTTGARLALSKAFREKAIRAILTELREPSDDAEAAVWQAMTRDFDRTAWHHMIDAILDGKA